MECPKLMIKRGYIMECVFHFVVMAHIRSYFTSMIDATAVSLWPCFTFIKNAYEMICPYIGTHDIWLYEILRNIMPEKIFFTFFYASTISELEIYSKTVHIS